MSDLVQRLREALEKARDTFRDFERVNRAIGRAEQATAAGIAREACDEALDRPAVETPACTDPRGHKWHKPGGETQWTCPSCGATRPAVETSEPPFEPTEFGS